MQLFNISRFASIIKLIVTNVINDLKMGMGSENCATDYEEQEMI
jgi:hypothetical protein